MCPPVLYLSGGPSHNLKPDVDLSAEPMWLTFSRNASSRQNSAWGNTVLAQPAR